MVQYRVCTKLHSYLNLSFVQEQGIKCAVENDKKQNNLYVGAMGYKALRYGQQRTS